MTDGVVATTARALVSSRLLSVPTPIAVLRLIREVYRGGTNLSTLLAVAAARWPDRTAIIDDDGALSYRELQSKTEALAHELVRDGAGPGEAVGIMCRNGRDFAGSVFAAALVGADVVLVNTEFRATALATALGSHQVRTCSATTSLPSGSAMPRPRWTSSTRRPCRAARACRDRASSSPVGSSC